MENNTVTFVASDGKEASFPTEFLIERKALVVDKINGEALVDVVGCANQLWIPGFPAKYFVRDIAEIRFSHQEVPPALPIFQDDGHDFANCPNVSCRADFNGWVGEPMLFEGWADDFGKRIVAIEFSLDSGATWTRHLVEGADAVRWVWWRFEWVPELPGAYTMLVRAVNEDDKASPHPAALSFNVSEGRLSSD